MGRKIPEIVTLAFLFFFISCKKEPSTSAPPDAKGRKVFVVCEGSLGNGNSSLGLYRPDVDSFYADVFRAANQTSLGDVFQSMTRIGSRYFLCINNSDKIIVIDTGTFQYSGTIPVPKPRYILPVSEDKAYVSALFGNQLHTINPKTLAYTGSIHLPAQNPEGMIYWQDQVVVCCWDTANQKLFMIHPETDQITGTHTLPGAAPQEAVADYQGNLWVLSGNAVKGKPAFLTRIHPSGNILQALAFPEEADAMRPVMNPTRDTVYFIEVNYQGGTAHNGIYRMPVDAHALPQTPFLPAQAFQYFWGLDIAPGTGEIYVGDPKGFIQKGTVMIYQADGSLIRQFSTGVGPGHFYFDD